MTQLTEESDNQTRKVEWNVFLKSFLHVIANSIHVVEYCLAIRLSALGTDLRFHLQDHVPTIIHVQISVSDKTIRRAWHDPYAKVAKDTDKCFLSLLLVFEELGHLRGQFQNKGIYLALALDLVIVLVIEEPAGVFLALGFIIATLVNKPAEDGIQ